MIEFVLGVAIGVTVVGLLTIWQIRYLQSQNEGLLGCLYHRVGYKPPTKQRKTILGGSTAQIEASETPEDEQIRTPRELTLQELQELARNS